MSCIFPQLATTKSLSMQGQAVGVQEPLNEVPAFSLAQGLDPAT